MNTTVSTDNKEPLQQT